MRIDGIQLVEGSNVSNLTVSSGTTFPISATVGEMFFDNSSESSVQGLYLYTGSEWTRVSTERQLVSPSGPALPSAGESVPGQVFFLNSNDATEGLYFYDVDLGWRASSASSSGVSTTITGDVLGTIIPGTESALTLPAIVSPGIYKSVEVNAKGQITSGTNPTTLAGYGITDALVLDADLTAISNLTGTGLARRTEADTWALDSSAYLTSNQLVTVQGDATGTGTTTITLTLSNVNSNIGTVGSATAIPILTVNAKGLVTGTSSAALSSTNVPEGTNLYFTSARANAASPVQSVAGRTGAVSLSVSDVSGAAALASPTFTGTVSGITKSMVGLANVDNTSDANKPISTAEQTALNLKANLASPTFTGTVSGITKSMVGLANVDNTSDLSKPVSTATSAAIAALTTTTIAEGTNLYYTPVRAVSAISAANTTISGTWAFTNPVTSAEPTAGTHLATKQYVDNITTGLDFKASVKAASTTNILLSGMQIVDNIGLNAGDRVLVKDQTDNTQNGIYSVGMSSWTRTFDADNTPGTEITAGMYCFVEQGTVNADTGWVLTTTSAVVLGTTGLTFAQFTGLGQVSAGTGLSKTGSTLSLSNTGTAGTYTSVTTDAYGRVVSGGQASTSNITEGSNLYFTNSRAQFAISATGSGLSYSPSTGVVTSNGTASNVPMTLAFRDASGNFSAGVITASLAGNASSASILNNARSISASGDGVWTVNFDGSTAVTSAFTLATVNASAGTFGSSTAVPIFTVNAKGLITSASSVALNTTNITEGTNLYFTTARGAASAPVQSVAGRTGAISLLVSDVSGAAPLASPMFTGAPIAPTAGTADSSNTLATTAFVKAQGYVTSAGAVSSAPVQSVAGRTGAIVLTVSDISGAAPLASPTFTGTVSGITKSMAGLANVDNTSDLSKPVSTATQTALDLKANLASPTFTGTVSGITKSMVGLANVDNTSDLSKPVSSAQQTALDLKANLASPTFTGTVSGITATMVGLGNVNNTSDASKPISAATQTALDLKANQSTTYTKAEVDASTVSLNRIIGTQGGVGATITNSLNTSVTMLSTFNVSATGGGSVLSLNENTASAKIGGSGAIRPAILRVNTLATSSAYPVVLGARGSIILSITPTGSVNTIALSGSSTDVAGAILIQGGQAGSFAGTGGNVAISSGNSDGAGLNNAGLLSLTGGTGQGNAAAGPVSLAGGGAFGGIAGPINITSGAHFGTGASGDINVYTGTSAASIAGTINIGTASTTLILKSTGITISGAVSTDNTITGTSFIGSGSALTNLTGANVTGTVPAATIAGTITGIYSNTITSAQVTNGLGFTPYNSTNPAGYITSAGAPVQSVAGRTGAVILTISDVSGIIDGGSF